MRSRGGGCTTSSLAAAARAPPVPEVRLRQPPAQAFPRAPRSRAPPPSTLPTALAGHFLRGVGGPCPSG